MPCVVAIGLVVYCEYVLKIFRKSSVLKGELKLTWMH